MCLNTVLLMFVVQAIPMTPIRVKVDPSHDASKVKAEGPGLSRTGKKPVQWEKYLNLSLYI